MSKRLTYRHDKIKKTYPASDCMFAVQGYGQTEVTTFIDGDLSKLILMFSALFQTILNQNIDVACSTLEACMTMATKTLDERDKVEALTGAIMDMMDQNPAQAVAAADLVDQAPDELEINNKDSMN